MLSKDRGWGKTEAVEKTAARRKMSTRGEKNAEEERREASEGFQPPPRVRRGGVGSPERRRLDRDGERRRDDREENDKGGKRVESKRAESVGEEKNAESGPERSRREKQVVVATPAMVGALMHLCIHISVVVSGLETKHEERLGTDVGYPYQEWCQCSLLCSLCYARLGPAPRLSVRSAPVKIQVALLRVADPAVNTRCWWLRVPSTPEEIGSRVCWREGPRAWSPHLRPPEDLSGPDHPDGAPLPPTTRTTETTSRTKESDRIVSVDRRSRSDFDAVTRIEQGRKQSLAGATKTRLSGNKFDRGVIEDKRTGTGCTVTPARCGCHAEGKEADENNVCTPVRTMETRRAKPPEPAGGRGSVIRAGCLGAMSCKQFPGRVKGAGSFSTDNHRRVKRAAPMVRGVGLTEEKEEERTEEDRAADGGGGSWVGGEYANVIDITF
ncbi:hypothetical protein WN48_05011 [Eufriesea mexicana]|nr:hypothetical protein WN48_05011 [Eufriesea mexicana]